MASTPRTRLEARPRLDMRHRKPSYPQASPYRTPTANSRCKQWYFVSSGGRAARGPSAARWANSGATGAPNGHKEAVSNDDPAPNEAADLADSIAAVLRETGR